MTAAHALLSPSSADRWLHCPPSVRLGEQVPQRTGESAEEGRLAHAVAELYARKRFTPLPKRTFNSQLKKLQADPRYHKDMEYHAQNYADVLAEHAMSFGGMPHTALEVAVPIGATTGEAGASGTADCIQIGEGVLWVTDYKYGKGVPVDARENPQMMLYALGALQLYLPIYGAAVTQVRLTVYQPRLGGASDWGLNREALEGWGHSTVAPAAALALAGRGERAAGDWCRFCPVRPTCRTRAQEAISLEEAFGLQMPPLLTDTEVGDALARGARLQAWYSDLKRYALSACLAGKDIPGWMAVEGHGSRVWADQDAAFSALQERGVAEALLWERCPVTPPALEKALGEAQFGTLAEGLVQKLPGKPALAPADDKRPKYTPVTAENAFKTEEDIV